MNAAAAARAWRRASCRACAAVEAGVLVADGAAAGGVGA